MNIERGTIYLGNSADLRHLYGAEESGREYLGSRRTYFNAHAIKHMAEMHPERREWLVRDLGVLRQAIQSPDIVYRRLDYKRRMAHWVRAFVVKHPIRKQRYVSVVLSLGNLSGDESDFHQVITVHLARERDFFVGGDLGCQRIKDRWIEVNK